MRRTGAALLLLAWAGCTSKDTSPAPTAVVTDVTDLGAAPEVPERPPPALSRPTLSTQRLTIDGTRLRDALGREVLLRGVNTGGRAKLPPFFAFPFKESGIAGQEGAPPFAEAVDAYFARIAAWGLNVVRFPFTWEAVEPTRGTYDTVFLDRYEQAIAAAAKHGLRVLVDQHQDVFARPYCGDGMPLWACKDPPKPPYNQDCVQWFLHYLEDKALHAAFDRLWKNEDGLIDAMKAMWVEMARRAWKHDNVIGFELLNEPHAGTTDHKTWAKDVLAPFYADVCAAIRTVAADVPCFFDATGQEAVIAKTEVPLPKATGLVFAPHYYDAGAIALKTWLGTPKQISDALAQWRAQGDAWGIPVLVGEFGMSPAAPLAAEYVRANFDGLDAARLHGTLWEVSTTADDWNDEDMSITGEGGKERETAAEVVRVYPQAVAGSLVSFVYDALTRKATLVIDAVDGVTELAVPKRLYPGGVTVSVDAPSASLLVDDRALVRVNSPGRATVTVTPR